MPAEAAALFKQTDLADYHVLVYRLTHVINRECTDAGGSQRFHLHAGLTAELASREDVNAVAFLIQTQVNSDRGQHKRVAQWY